MSKFLTKKRMKVTPISMMTLQAHIAVLRLTTITKMEEIEIIDETKQQLMVQDKRIQEVQITQLKIKELKHKTILGAPDKPCGVGRADANPKLLLNDT